MNMQGSPPKDEQTAESTFEEPAVVEKPVDQERREEQRMQARVINVHLTGIIAIGMAFLIPGILALGLSIHANSQVLAFIGLGLTLWGAVFFLIRPEEYVKGNLLAATVTSSYQTIDRILKELEPKGTALYVPPYPKEVYLPEHLRGLKESIVFIPTAIKEEIPSIEDIAQSKFITKNPRGICLDSLGFGLMTQFEKEIKTDLSRMNLEELCEAMPPLILENFQLAKEIEMHPEKNQVHARIMNSIYKSLYLEPNLKSVRSIGCPLVSAIASAIAKNTGKPVTIETLNTSPDAETIEVTYRIVEG